MSDLIYSTTDHASYSRPDEAVIVNTHLDWRIDFDSKTIDGTAKHTVKLLKDKVSFIYFDSNNLNISDISIADTSKTDKKYLCEWALSTAHVHFGSKITVTVPSSLQQSNSQFDVTFTYSTTELSTAVQWLSPAETAGGIHPYVFTQCQAIHARSLLPCMDTPSIKSPYSATVTAPSWCTVLMSAIVNEQAVAEAAKPSTPPKKSKNKKKSKSKSSATAKEDDSPASDDNTFKFTQPVAVPSYLIALAAGKLSSKDISKRVRVWAEPEVVDSAAFEFSETEQFLSVAESFGGTYPWGRYDVLCLPPSFLYGGMENPCLTFATPTLLAGDRSLADVIAHEIAHSWTGNLITNATWSHFWLNEGWTVWLERKIISKVKGIDHLKLSARIGWEGVQNDFQRLMSDGDADGFSQLVIPYKDQDPDDAFSRVPYDKGFTFLYYLESVVGTEEFEQFFKQYVTKFQYGLVTSGTFKDFFMQFFTARNEALALITETASQLNAKAAMPSQQAFKIDAIDWNTWLLGKGTTPVVHDFTNSLSMEVDEFAERFFKALNNDEDLNALTYPSIKQWPSAQTCVLLDKFLSSPMIDANAKTHIALKKLDTLFDFISSRNCEIKFRWLMIGLKAEASWVVESAVVFVKSQGRMKYVRPLYRAMRKSQVAAEAAVTTFNEHADRYHPIARKMIELDLSKFEEIAELQEEINSIENVLAESTTLKGETNQLNESGYEVIDNDSNRQDSSIVDIGAMIANEELQSSQTDAAEAVALAEAKAKADAEAEAEEIARLEALAKVKAEAEAKAQAEAERARVEAEAKAKADAEAKALAEAAAKAEAEAKAKAQAQANAKAEAEAKAIALAEAEERARAAAEAKVKAEEAAEVHKKAAHSEPPVEANSSQQTESNDLSVRNDDEISTSREAENIARPSGKLTKSSPVFPFSDNQSNMLLAGGIVVASVLLSFFLMRKK